MSIFNFLFGKKNNKVQAFLSKGAIIVDVRSNGEYKSGAIPNSKNIPLQNIVSKIQNIKNYKNLSLHIVQTVYVLEAPQLF